MYKIQFKREPNYKQNEYCILQFKGKFETDAYNEQSQQKSMIHLGQLKKTLEGKYKLEIGIMDLVGKQVKLLTKQIVTETLINQANNSKLILIKGMVTKKIVFQGRPAPDMDRAVSNKRDSVSHKMFDKIQEKKQLAFDLKQKQKEKGKGKQIQK